MLAFVSVLIRAFFSTAMSKSEARPVTKNVKASVFFLLVEIQQGKCINRFLIVSCRFTNELPRVRLSHEYRNLFSQKQRRSARGSIRTG